MKYWISTIVTLGLCLVVLMGRVQDKTIPNPAFWADGPSEEFILAGWTDWPSWDGDDPPIDLSSIVCHILDAPPKTEDVAGTLPPIPEDEKRSWSITVGSWNLKNFYTSKAYTDYVKGKDLSTLNVNTVLVDRIADISATNDIIFFQELQWGSNTDKIFPPPLKKALVARGFNGGCHVMGPRMGFGAYKEAYGYCYRIKTLQGVGIEVNHPLVQPRTATNLKSPANPQDPKNYCGQQIWMRPPGLATVKVSPPKDSPVTFAMYNTHTRPEYNSKEISRSSNRKPPWFLSKQPIAFPSSGNWPRVSTSVYYELKALQDYITRLATNDNIIVLGDLNSDAPTFPLDLQTYAKIGGEAFLGGAWSWTFDSVKKMQTTNVGELTLKRKRKPTDEDEWFGNSSRVLDQFILNSNSKRYDLGSSIEQNAQIADKVEGTQVSDHYMIRQELGLNHPKKPTPRWQMPKASIACAIGIFIYDALYQGCAIQNILDSNTSNDVYVSAITQNSEARTADLYVIKYDEGVLFKNANTINLEDVRSSGPTAVIFSDSGKMSTPNGGPVKWQFELGVGLYKFVIDVNKDGNFNAKSGDMVNSPTAYDMLVYDEDIESDYHPGYVRTVGDDGKPHANYSSGKAMNIYYFLQFLEDHEISDEVDIYVVSMKRLNTVYEDTTAHGWTWGNSQGIGNLTSVSVPVNMRKGPVIVDQVVKENVVKTVNIDKNRSIFGVAWPSPITLFSGKSYQSVVKPLPVLMPSDAVSEKLLMFGSTCNIDPETLGVSLEDYNDICNAGDLFINMYGTKYTIVIDVDQDGRFSAGDLAGTVYTESLEEYFNGDVNNLILNQNSYNFFARSAIEGFQRILYDNTSSAEQSMRDPFGSYDLKTEQFSERVICNKGLTRDFYNNTIKPNSQSGFHLLPETINISGDDSLDTNHRRAINYDASGNDPIESDNSSACISVLEEAIIDNSTRRSSTAISADRLSFYGRVSCTIKESGESCNHYYGDEAHITPGTQIHLGTSIMPTFHDELQ